MIVGPRLHIHIGRESLLHKASFAPIACGRPKSVFAVGRIPTMLLLEVVMLLVTGLLPWNGILLLALLLLLLHQIVHSVPAIINILLETISDQVSGDLLQWWN